MRSSTSSEKALVISLSLLINDMRTLGRVYKLEFQSFDDKYFFYMQVQEIFIIDSDNFCRKKMRKETKNFAIELIR